MSPKVAVDKVENDGENTEVPVRRFEMGASGTGADAFLTDLGYTITKPGSYFHVRRPGRRKTESMTTTQLVKLLDEERIKAGLEPIRRRK